MVTSAAIPTGAPVSPFGFGGGMSMGQIAPMLLGSLGQQFSGSSQPRFATDPRGVQGGQGGGQGGFGAGGMGGGIGGINPLIMQLLRARMQQNPQANAPMTPWGLLGHGVQNYLGPQSQAGWGMGTSVNPMSPVPPQGYGGG